MRIVVDVMGGDHGCDVVIAGVRLALEANPRIATLYLVGKESEIQASLQRQGFHDPRLQVVHADEVLTMEDKPIVGLRRKKDCSIAKAVDLVQSGQAEALVSPGNTGGVVAASTLRLGRLKDVERAAIATVIPAPENEFVLVDAGANVDCKPLQLLQFAIMGSVYSRQVLRYPKPRVGLLSVGTEDVKGNELTLETFKLCKKIDLNFIGNIEGHDLFENHVDVVVCDGFVGNIVLKTCESIAGAIFGWLKRELTMNPQRKLGALLAQGAFKTIKKRMDPDAYGGAPLLGVKGEVMIAHGSARERAIMNAIRMASEAVENRITETITREIQAANQRLSTPGEPLLAPALS